MSDNLIASIARTFEELKTAKARRKDLNKQLSEEVKAHPDFEKADTALTEARTRMTAIKADALASSKLEPDIDDAKEEVKALQAVLDDLMAQAIAEGVAKNGQEMELGQFTVTPKVKVAFSMKQMSLEL